MDHDEVQIFVLHALLGRIRLGDGFLVERVEDGDALEERMAGYAGQVAELVDHHRIGDEGTAADLLGDGVGQDAAQVAGVLSVIAGTQVGQHAVIDLVHAGRNGAQQVAAAYDG